MTICNGGIRLVELEILMVMLGQKDNGKSKSYLQRFALKSKPRNSLKVLLSNTFKEFLGLFDC
jgi:hypothetical protein